MPRTNSIKQIRAYYGLTQEQLAIFLSVSKGYVAMAEIGRRTLPTKTLVKLAQLEMLQTTQPLNTVTQKAKTQLQKTDKADTKVLQRYADDCSIQTLAMQRQLSKMEEKHKQAIHALQLVEQWQQHGIANKKDTLWLNSIESTALKQVKRYEEGAQQLLRIKLAVCIYAEK